MFIALICTAYSLNIKCKALVGVWLNYKPGYEINPIERNINEMH